MNLTSGLFTDCRASLSNLSPSGTSISKSKYPAAHLQRLTSNYAILRHYMSEVDRINFATLLSQLLFVHEPLLDSGGQHTMLQHDTSGSELAVNFLESDLCMEARDLQSHLLAKAVEVFSSLMTSRYVSYKTCGCSYAIFGISFKVKRGQTCIQIYLKHYIFK